MNLNEQCLRETVNRNLASFVLVVLATGSYTPGFTTSVPVKAENITAMHCEENIQSTIKTNDSNTCACNRCLRLVDKSAKEYKCGYQYIESHFQESKRNQRGIIFHIRSRSFAAQTSSARAQERHSDTSALFSAPSSSATYRGSAYPRSRSQT